MAEDLEKLWATAQPVANDPELEKLWASAAPQSAEIRGTEQLTHQVPKPAEPTDLRPAAGTALYQYLQQASLGAGKHIGALQDAAARMTGEPVDSSNMGLGEKLASGARTVGGLAKHALDNGNLETVDRLSDLYDKYLHARDAEDRRAAQSHPWSAALGRLAGGLHQGGGGLAGQVAAGAVTGGLEATDNPLLGAAAGGVLGAAGSKAPAVTSATVGGGLAAFGDKLGMTPEERVVAGGAGVLGAASGLASWLASRRAGAAGRESASMLGDLRQNQEAARAALREDQATAQSRLVPEIAESLQGQNQQEIAAAQRATQAAQKAAEKAEAQGRKLVEGQDLAIRKRAVGDIRKTLAENSEAKRKAALEKAEANLAGVEAKTKATLAKRFRDVYDYLANRNQAGLEARAVKGDERAVKALKNRAAFEAMSDEAQIKYLEDLSPDELRLQVGEENRAMLELAHRQLKAAGETASKGGMKETEALAAFLAKQEPLSPTTVEQAVQALKARAVAEGTYRLPKPHTPVQVDPPPTRLGYDAAKETAEDLMAGRGLVSDPAAPEQLVSLDDYLKSTNPRAYERLMRARGGVPPAAPDAALAEGLSTQVPSDAMTLADLLTPVRGVKKALAKTVLGRSPKSPAEQYQALHRSQGRMEDVAWAAGVGAKASNKRSQADIQALVEWIKSNKDKAKDKGK